MQNGLMQVVDCPTHDPNCIDIVLASNRCLICDLAVVEPFSSTCVHSSVDFSILSLGVSKPNSSFCFWDLSHADNRISYLLDVD